MAELPLEVKSSVITCTFVRDLNNDENTAVLFLSSKRHRHCLDFVFFFFFFF